MKKTAFGAAIIATIYACTKEAKESQLITQQSSLSAVKANSVEKVSKKPVLTAVQSPAPVTVGNEVTITYKATDATTGFDVGCGRIFIYQWNGTQWLEVANAKAPSATYTFTPATATDCAYKFRAGFAPGGGEGGVNCSGDYAGVDYTTEPDFCVDVQQQCVEKFTITSDVQAQPVTNGQYEFTITYTLTSPVDVAEVKFQGGATAGGKVGSTITEYGNTEIVNENNNNTVLKWNGALKACTPQKVSFKYRRNFTCTGLPQAITGGWSASTPTTELGAIDPLTFSCN